MFYTYNQNNSGGKFHFNEEDGITHIVIIEADDVIEANFKAESVGIYFNGVEEGRDCECCGDRWYETSGKWDVSETPTVYDEPAKSYTGFQWMENGKEICIHYKNGKKKWYGVKKKK
jgi:hypothetical protein